jgi:hypothetical protein
MTSWRGIMLVGFMFETNVPEEAEMAEKCWEFQRQQRLGVNEAGLAHIVNTVSGQRVVVGAASNFQPSQRFTRADLAAAIGEDEQSVFSWIRQLGRPERKFGMKVFTHHDDGSYSIAENMHVAILRLAERE